MCPKEVLDERVHVPKDEHFKGYVKKVQLVDYDIHNYAAFPKFMLEKYSEWQGEELRTLKPFQPLFKSGLINLLHVLCFGNSPAVRKCVRLLLSRTNSFLGNLV